MYTNNKRPAKVSTASLLKGYLKTLNKLRVLAGYELLVGDKLRNYERALLAGLLISATTPLIILRYFLGIDLFRSLLVTLLIPPIIVLTPLLTYYLRALSRAKVIEHEFRYFVIAEGIILDKSSELIRDLMDVGSWGEVFPNLHRESMKIKKLGKMLTLFNAVKTYVKLIKSKEVGRALLDYLFSLSLGASHAWVKEKSDEWVGMVRLEAYSKIKLRATISILLAIALGYTPPLVVMLSVIIGANIVKNALMATIAIALASFAVTPRLPIHLNISTTTLNRRYIILSSLPFVVAMSTYAVALNTKLALIAFSLTAIATGIPKLHDYLSNLRELLELPRILALMSEAPLALVNPLEVLRRALITSRSRRLKELGRGLSKNTRELISRLRSTIWLSKYSMYILIRGISSGSLSRERVLKLRELIIDLIKDIKASLATSVIVVSIALALPLILSSVNAIATAQNHHLGSLVFTYDIIALVVYGIYAGYVIFSDPLNTLICGTSLLMFILTTGGNP